ncbi:radical SAM protein [Paraclostridium benzoelyticum]|uniref:radical SAM/SPASM domain-containing protein n=1 Tax=Paraclostridium benzoelyticum TaxID=1629550 RepID=UPI0031CD31B0
MMCLDKESSYFCKVDNKKGIVSNRFTGEYRYIPIECFDAIMHATERNIPLDKMSIVFEDLEYQKYYLKLLEILLKLGVTTEIDNKINTINMDYLHSIDISLTNRCNLNCGYCCTESGKVRPNEMNIEEIKKMIDNIVLFLKPKFINLSGGEIFIRDDIYEIIEYTRRKFQGVLSISTNGTLIKEEKLDFLVKNIDLISISLDGYNEETVSYERGKGVFSKVIKLITNLKKKNFNKINLSFVLSKKTEPYLEEFKKLTKSLQVGEIIRDFVALGRGEVNLPYVEDEKDVEFFDENIDPNLYYENAMVCNAGIKSIFINYDKSIYMCALLQDEKFKICNVDEINESFLEKISNEEFKSYQNLENLKMKTTHHCSKCGYKLFCCKCPATMNLIYDNEKLLKHNCKKFKNQLGI